MPKSKRAKVVHLTQTGKKTHERKERLFTLVRAEAARRGHVVVFVVDNMRNAHLKQVRHDLAATTGAAGPSRLFFGKTKLMARALGLTPEDAAADGLDALAPHLRGSSSSSSSSSAAAGSSSSLGLLFTDRDPAAGGDLRAYLDGVQSVDFCRPGAVAPCDVAVPPGVVYSTGGHVPRNRDVLVAPALEPELRRLGMPTRLVRGKVVLGGDEQGAGSSGYVVCRRGEVLDARQTRLLHLFSICLAEFRVRVVAYWSANTGTVTVVDPNAMDVAEADDGEDAEAGDVVDDN